MGGGKKQTQRTKGNLKPSSSSRAAESLLQEGKTGFIGFGGLSEATGNAFGYVPKAIGTDNEAEHEIDSELRMLMRKMTKKDTTTRLKAVQEFSKLCSDKSADCVSRTLSFWPKIYNKLTEDFDHRVREAIQQAHLEIVRKVGRKLAPQLKLIISNWLKSHFDQYPPAAVIAKRSFDLSFSGDKKREALSFCKKELILNMQDVLIQQTQDTLSDPKVIPVEEREAKYNRIISATLFSFGFLLDNLSSTDIESLSNEIQSILKEKKFWKFSKHKSAMIRNAFFTAVSSCCHHCKDIIKELSAVACPTVLLCLDESDPTVVRSVWECCLHIVNTIEDCWDRVNARKAVLPKLWSVLKAGGHGNATVIFPNILPFLSKVPSTVIGDGDGFFKEFFGNFREGLSSDKASASSSESVAIMSAFMECLQYVMLNKIKETNDDVDREAIYDYLINEEIRYFTEASLEEGKKFWKKVFLKKLSEFISYLEKQTRTENEKLLPEKTILGKLYILLENTCLKSLKLEKIEGESMERNLLGNLEVLIKIVILKSNVTLKEQKKNIKFENVDSDGESNSLTSSSLPFNKDSDGGQNNMVPGEELSELSRDLLSKLCTCSVELLLSKKKLVYLSFMCNVMSDIKDKSTLVELIKLILDTRQNLIDGSENEAGYSEDLLSLGNVSISRFITPVVEESISLEASFWNSLDCQEAVVGMLCSILMFIDSGRRNDFLTTVDGFCSKPSLHCLLVEKVLACVDVDTVMLWFSNGECWNRLINYISQCLMSSDEEDESNTDYHIWKCIQQCLFYDAGEVPLLNSEKTERLFISFKNYLTSFASDQDPKKCLRILLIMTDVYKRGSKNETIPILITDLLVAAFQVTFRIEDDEVLTQSNEMLHHGLDLLRVSSSEKMNEFLQRIAYWLKKTCHEIQDLTRLTKLACCTVNLVKYLNINEGDATQSNTMNLLVNQLLECSDVKALCSKGIQLLPSVMSGVLNITNLHSEQDVTINLNQDLQKALNSAVYGTLLLSKLEADLEGSSKVYTTVLNAVNLCAYGDEEMIQRYDLGFENTENVKSSILQLENNLKALLRLEQVDKENLLKISLERAMVDGGVHLLTFDRLCKMVSELNQSDLPSSELLALAMSRGYDDLDSVDVLKVILTYLNDVSMMRAMVEQFSDQLSDVSPEDIQEFSRCLDLCMTSLMKWQQVLQDTEEKSHDFTDVIRTIMNQLIGWKDNAQEALLFATDLSEVEISLIDVNIKIIRLICFVLAAAPESLEATHWDFILCSLASWIQTCEDNLSTISQDPCKMIFGFEAFNLCACAGLAFERLIGTNVLVSNVIKPELGVSCISRISNAWRERNPGTITDDLLSEWQEFFAPAIYKGVYMLYKATLSLVSESGQSSKDNKTALSLHLLQSLSCALDSIPAMVFIDIIICKQSIEEQLATGATQQNLESRDFSFDKKQISLIQETVNLLSTQLTSEFCCVQTVAMSLLCKMIDHVHAAIATMTDESTEGDECDLVRSFPDKMHSVLETCQEIIIRHLDDQSIKIGAYLHQVPTDELKTNFLGYMFSWQCILRMFRGAEADQRAAYANFFRKRGLVGPLLRILFSLLPYEAGSLLAGRSVSIKGEKISLHTLRQCAFQVYLSALECLPAVIRSWCNNNMDRKGSSIIERFTCSYVSPILCNRELDQVSSSSKTFTNMSIKTRPAAREVVALYTVEEISIELVVKMSQSHPLGHVAVECGKRVGVTNSQWRQWMLQLTMYLTQQNGTIVDGLSLWKKNVDKKFEGVEECMVCFSVVHGTNYQLPTISCRVCKKKFHSACLYKWFSTSNKSTCPLCRNSF